MERLKIKICGLTDSRNLLEIAGMGIDFAGFNFVPGSPRCISYNNDNVLLAPLPAYVNRTGVFANQDTGFVISTARKYSLSYIQLHGNESAAYCKLIRDEGLMVIRAFTVGSIFDFLSMKPFTSVCDLFLFDSRTPGDMKGGIKFNWSLLSAYTLPTPFLLAGGIGPSDALPIRDIVTDKMLGIDLNSRFELTPGIKDTKKVREFIKILNS